MKMERQIAKVVQKPWGHEKIWAMVDGKYLGKTITINGGHRLSRQYHVKKEETIYVIEGTLHLELGQDKDGMPEKLAILNPGDYFHIRPGLIHRFCATNNQVTLCEVSTYYPDDVVRLNDDYGR